VRIGGAKDLKDSLDKVQVDRIDLYDEVCGPFELDVAIVGI
jgi:hypothetical protein